MVLSEAALIADQSVRTLKVNFNHCFSWQCTDFKPIMHSHWKPIFMDLSNAVLAGPKSDVCIHRKPIFIDSHGFVHRGFAPHFHLRVQTVVGVTLSLADWSHDCFQVITRPLPIITWPLPTDHMIASKYHVIVGLGHVIIGILHVISLIDHVIRSVVTKTNRTSIHSSHSIHSLVFGCTFFEAFSVPTFLSFFDGLRGRQRDE